MNRPYKICDALPHAIPCVQGIDFCQSLVNPTVATHGVCMVVFQEILHFAYLH